MSKVKLVKSTKTGRIYIATAAMLARPDMRGVIGEPEKGLPEGDDDGYLAGGDDDTLLNQAGGSPAGQTGGDTDTDEDEQSGGDIDLTKFNDEDLIAFANAEPYNLGATKGWKRSTIESKLLEAMGG